MNYRECFQTLANKRDALNPDQLELQSLFNEAHYIVQELSDPYTHKDMDIVNDLLEQHDWLIQKIQKLLNINNNH